VKLPSTIDGTPALSAAAHASAGTSPTTSVAGGAQPLASASLVR
jgi:hypothetical protein